MSAHVGTKKARTHRVVLDQLRVHERDGTLPTTARFLFYELEQRGEARKPSPDDVRPNKRRSIGWPPGSQDITDALTCLRDEGEIPWEWIVDTERSVAEFAHAPSVAEYLRERLAEATINPFGTSPPPLILCEDRGTAEVLEQTAGAYSCPIAGTKGHANGFLRTVIAPQYLTDDGELRDVLYLGDLDRSGEDIEANTRCVLEDAAPDWIGDWERIALTYEQVEERGITPMFKKDGRDGTVREAWELQALGQATLVRMLGGVLAALVPESLASVRERERAQQAAVAEFLSTWDGDR
jgi:hypothetical protein